MRRMAASVASSSSSMPRGSISRIPALYPLRPPHRPRYRTTPLLDDVHQHLMAPPLLFAVRGPALHVRPVRLHVPRRTLVVELDLEDFPEALAVDSIVDR